MTRSILIDTDTASDDAVAILMAARTPDIDIKAVTIVAGNMPVAQASLNARYTLELCGKTDVPVYHGADAPLMRDVYRAYFFHGPDGMGNMNYPAPKMQPKSDHAVDAMIETIKANPGIMLVTLGPMTNVALALAKAPEIAKNVSRCVVMGGAANVVGNVTPAAEYNIWCDPEAARMAFRSDLPIEMVGWELCRGEANLSDEEMRYCKETINTSYSNFAIDCNFSALEANRNWLGDPGLGLPDPTAMAIAIDPTICTRSSKHYVEIECDGTYTRGMTVIDQCNVTDYDTENVAMWQPIVKKGKPHVTICWSLDAKRWKELLYKCLS
ncbi:MAG: nucleoside hydrolase [Anaerolineae bacterium]|nr:nucleoside hydrolase [Anaerolineae bacterium]